MNIEISGSININSNYKTVFAFLANLENDKLWRKEINFTKVSGMPGIGVKATESSFLSKRTPNHMLELICTDFTENQKIEYKTSPDSECFLWSQRHVETLSADMTKVTYSLKFSKNIVKRGLGFNLPNFIIRMAAQSDMKKYLAKLKTILETNKP